MQNENEELLLRMDRAAERAKVDLLRLIDNMTEEEIVGIKKLVGWFSRHYLKAGWNRLGRIVKDLRFS